MTQRKKLRRQTGLTILELLIAMVVLAVGLGGALVLFTAAIGGNSRSRLDTQAVQVSQTVMEALAAGGGASVVTVPDCAGNSLSLTTATGGSTLDSRGDISWTSTQVSGYSANYVSCGASGSSLTYEVRWQIGTTSYSGVKLINVSSRLKNAPASGGRLFSLPTTLHTMAGAIY